MRILNMVCVKIDYRGKEGVLLTPYKANYHFRIAGLNAPVNESAINRRMQGMMNNALKV